MKHTPIFGVDRVYMWLVVSISVLTAWIATKANLLFGESLGNLAGLPLLLIPLGWAFGFFMTRRNPNWFMGVHVRILRLANQRNEDTQESEENGLSGDVCPQCHSEKVETLGGDLYDGGALRTRQCYDCGCLYREHYKPAGVEIFQRVPIDKKQ